MKRAKDQLKSNIVLGLESSSSRMANLARQEMYFGRFFSVDEIVGEVDAITAADVQALARQLFRPEAIALTLLGNLGALTVDRAASRMLNRTLLQFVSEPKLHLRCRGPTMKTTALHLAPSNPAPRTSNPALPSSSCSSSCPSC